MKDIMKPCQHTLSDDVVFKEVVVIGNGPSGMVTSFMLAGNVPYLKEMPEDLPIDDMLRARLMNIPKGQSLYETDLIELAEGLEGRSQNPIALLADNLLRPCADMGVQADSLIEWRYDVEKQLDHIVLGRGPPGGAWHRIPGAVRTLSPSAWLSLPPHSSAGGSPTERLPARAVANYCRRYVQACKLQRYFRNGVIVNSVSVAPRVGPPCVGAQCPRAAAFVVSGYDQSEGRPFRYLCRRVVVACGNSDRPNTLPPSVARHALHSLPDLDLALRRLALAGSHGDVAVAVVGSGVSAADAVVAARGAGRHVLHVHRAPPDALARLAPGPYPDYCQIYKMMCDGPSANHPNYTPYPDHVIVEVTPEPNLEHSPKLSDELEDETIRPKKVKLLNLVTNKVTEITVSLIAVLIGSKPDLFFLQTNFNFNCIDLNECKCGENTEKIEERRCFLRNHWCYIKNVLGQSIRSCKSRYMNSEINGNLDTKCILPDCEKREKWNINIEKTEKLPYIDRVKCKCKSMDYSDGIGFGVDPKKPVDGRSNPLAIDRGTHEMLNAPKGMYGLGPITGDNFVRFIPGGALAIVSHIHKDLKDAKNLPC